MRAGPRRDGDAAPSGCRHTRRRPRRPRRWPAPATTRRAPDPRGSPPPRSHPLAPRCGTFGVEVTPGRLQQLLLRPDPVEDLGLAARLRQIVPRPAAVAPGHVDLRPALVLDHDGIRVL